MKLEGLKRSRSVVSILVPSVNIIAFLLVGLQNIGQDSGDVPSVVPVLKSTQTNDVVILPPTTDPAEMMARDPFLRIQTNAQGQLLFTYEYYSGTNTSPTPPRLEINDEGAIANDAQHKVMFDGNLNHEDSIIIRLPDDQIIKARPSALSVSDDTGHRVWLGEVKDCEGSVLDKPGNQVVYTDAFTGIRADVLLTYDWNYIEQDIILREQPILPPEIDEMTARLEVWTEFLQGPEPERISKRIVLRDPSKIFPEEDQKDGVLAEDESLDFGSMRIMQGKAFRIGSEDESEKAVVPVAKRWVRDGNRAFLVESVDFLSIKPALQKVERRQAQASPITSTKNLAFLSKGTRGNIGQRTKLRSAKRMRLIAGLSPEPGVVIDYILVNTSLLNVDFGYGTTGKYGFIYRNSSNDFWNGVATPGSSSGSFPNLKYSDQVVSPIELVLANAPGHWLIQNSFPSINLSNPMFNDYVYNGSAQNLTVTLNNIPTGTYDFYIYGAWGGTTSASGSLGVVQGKYQLQVGATGYGLRETTLGPNWNTKITPPSTNWTVTEHYVLYANVSVSAGQQVVITAQPGGSSYPGGNIALINGLQMIRSGTGQPVVHLPIAPVTYSATSPPVLLDPAGQSTVSDDSVDFNGGSLDISYYAPGNNGHPGDRLSIWHQGNGTGQIGISGSTVSYGGTAIGTYSGGAGGGSGSTLTVVFTANATVASAQALLRNIQYHNANTNPVTGLRSLGVVLSDGDGGASGMVTGFSVDVGVNTSPTISAVSSQTINRNSTTGAIGFTVSDAQTPVGSLNVTATSGNQTVIPNSSVVVGGTGGNRTVTVNSGNVSGSAVITVTVTDGGGLIATRQFTVHVRLPMPSFSTTFNTDHSSATATGSSQAGAAVYYTTNGTEPTESSSTNSPSVSGCGPTVKAKAFQSGYTASETATWVCPGTTTAVTFSPNGHDPIQFSNGPLTLQMNAVSGATVFYRPTTGGSWSSTTSGTSVAVDGINSGNGSIEAYAFTSTSFRSATAISGDYSFRTPQPTHTISYTATTATLTFNTLPNALVDLYLNGSVSVSQTLTANASGVATASFPAANTLKVKARKSGYVESGLITAHVNKLWTPKIATAQGVLTSDLTVSGPTEIWLVPNLGFNNMYGEERNISGWTGPVAFSTSVPNDNFPGSFQSTAPAANERSSGALNVSAGRTYSMAGWFKGDGINQSYAGVINRDSTGAWISADDIKHPSYLNITWLTAPLSVGATTVSLANEQIFSPVHPVSYYNFLVPLLNYNRTAPLLGINQTNALADIYQQFTASSIYVTAVNSINKTVTLSAPHPGPALPTNTAIARRASGGTYQYDLLSNYLLSPNWTQHQATFSYIRPGTDSVHLMALLGLTGGSSSVTGLEIWEGAQANRPKLYYTINGGAEQQTDGPLKLQISSTSTISVRHKGTYYFDSDPVTRTITLNAIDSDGDQLSDAWETQHFGNLTQTGSGDWDGDGFTNLQEYLGSTDPTRLNGLQVFTPFQ